MRKYYSPLIGAALAAASLFQFSLPAFAAGTSAGTGLVNRATATYDDQNNNSYETTSNQVRVTVGKIAGITNVPINFTDNTSTATNTTILPGDSVSFDFEITNTGNDFTDIFIPESDDIAVENLVVDRVEYVFRDASGNIIQVNGEDAVVERGSSETVNGTTIDFGNGIIEGVDENTSIVIRVTATVSSTATEGDNISVQLGDTGTNTSDTTSTDYPGTQNQADLGAANDVQAQDVRTETAADAITAVDGDPVNGQREAGARVSRTVGSESLALARLEKVNTGVDAGADEGTLTDNIITYNLKLEVAGNTDAQVAGYTDFAFNAEDLEGRDYDDGDANSNTPATFNGISDTSNLILISDAIPANTDLEVGSVVSPTNGNWTPVYTESPLTTPADNAEWTTTAPTTQGDANSITRVGWVYDANGTSGAIAAGSNVTGFNFQVITTGITSNEATAIYNIAQVFGTTDNNGAGVDGLITYDESGDQNPANLNDNGSFGPDETATTSIDIDNDGTADDVFGFADADVDDDGTEDNVDVDNNNTALNSEAGEVNKVIVAPVATVSDLFNGPDGNADAVGDIFGVNPADDNHDFQNLAAENPDPNNNALTEADNNNDGYFESTYDPEAVVFTNTVSNPSQGTINNIILEPVGLQGLNLGGDNSDLEDGTTITITYDDGTNPAQTATYTVDTSDIATSLNTPTTGQIVTIPSIARNSTVDYTVSIDLPSDTQLSTDFEGGDPSNDLVGGYPVAIAAYIEDGTNTGVQRGEDVYNVTVNQVYTGYLQLVKKARVLRDNGSGTPTQVPGMGFNDPDNAKQPAPGDLLEYQITYTNISEDGGSGTGNGLLQADDVVIIEDGVAGNNNWAIDNDDPSEDGDTLIDTLHPLSGAENSIPNTTITYFDENGVGSTDPGDFSTELTNFEVTDDIVKYEVSGITRLEPGESGVFTFQRKITSAEDIEDLQ